MHPQKDFSFKNFIFINRWYFILLLGLVFLCYANALSNDFVSDDRGLLINVPSYTIDNIIGKSYFLRAVQYFLIYQIGGGLNPFFLRLPNIFFHLGSVWLIFLLISIFKNRIVGVFSAALFAVHPILVESVAWIAGGVYVEYSFFLLLSFVLYIQSTHSKKMYAFSILAFLLSLLSSEKAVVFCLIPFVYEICFGRIKKNWRRVGIYFLISFVFLLMFMGRLNERTMSILHTEDPSGQVFYNPFVQIPVAITSYFQLILWPDGLTLYHSEMSFSKIEYIVRFLVFFLFTIGMGISYKKNKYIFFWLSFFVITLLPTLTPLGIAWIVAERYVYLGSLGIFAIVGYGVQKLVENKQKRMVVYAAFSLIIVALMIRTIIRNVDWKNEDNLWLAAARTSPSSSQNHNNLGDYYGRNGDLVNAEREFKTAISLKPNYADAIHNLGNTYRDMGKLDRAIEQYEKALSINPKLWQSYQNISAIYYHNGNYDKAINYLKMGITANPQNPNLFVVLSIVYFKQGEKSRANETIETALKIDPNNNFAKEVLVQIQNNSLQ